MKELAPIFAAVLAFALTSISGFLVIPLLHKLKFGQTIREIGPSWHKNKQGTPTMGGIMMIGAVLISVGLSVLYGFLVKGRFYAELHNQKQLAYLLYGLALALLMGAIGFADDYIKVVKKRNLGLTALQKTVAQSLVTILYLLSLYGNGFDRLWLPFGGSLCVVAGAGWLFWPIAFFFIYGFTNAVNLTDGVDGLASGVTLVVCCTFMILSGFLHCVGLDVLAASVAGACGGFLLWNSHPAKVFMGDTGSMFLGGAVVGLAFMSERPILLILVGLVYLCEALSVVLQVASYKLTGKRIFKMSPIHHHFEMCGWSEEKIDMVFCLVTIVTGVLAVLLVL